MAKVRTFISFAAEDKNYRDLLNGQAKHPDSPFEIADWSVQEPFDEKWKTQCRERIKKTQVMIILISKTTHKAEGACWEVATAKEEGIPVFGVYIDKEDKGQIPKELSGNDVIEWTWDGINNMINKNVNKNTKNNSINITRDRTNKTIRTNRPNIKARSKNISNTVRCRRCHRRLSNPISIQRGYGSFCYNKI